MTSIAITGALIMLQEGPRRLTLRIAEGHIAAIGGSPQPGDRVIELIGHAVFPGMINAHDQLHLNAYPAFKRQPRCENARQWYADVDQYLRSLEQAEISKASLNDRLFAGGIKNLLAGTTTVLHHGNLSRETRSRRFPVRVVQRFGWMHSIHARQDMRNSYERTLPDIPWLIRIAEGLDDEAAQELQMLQTRGCLGPNTILIHGTGLDEAGRSLVQQANAGLVWCPAANAYILGETRFHVDLWNSTALGTGPRIAGSLDLLEEIRLAAQITGLLPVQLLAMVYNTPARLLRLPRAGKLAHNAPADLLIISNEQNQPHQALLESSRADLRLVMIGGKPRIGDEELRSVFQATRTPAVRVWLDGVPKLMARSLVSRFRRTGLEEPGLRTG